MREKEVISFYICIVFSDITKNKFIINILIVFLIYISAETMITRDCLSSVRSFRKDIPADRYEGCRPAAKDVQLGHYVNNSIWQLDIHRDYYDEVTWCFCYFDHRCNNADSITVSTVLLLLGITIQQFATQNVF